MKAITRSDFLYLERERIEVRVHGADTWVCPYVGADLRFRPNPHAREATKSWLQLTVTETKGFFVSGSEVIAARPTGSFFEGYGQTVFLDVNLLAIRTPRQILQ